MTIHFYIARKFTWIFLGLLTIFFILMALINLMEELRRFDIDEVGFASIILLTLLKAPEGLYQLLPLIIVLSTVALFVGLARTSELVVTRAAGRSALLSLLSPTAVALLIGVFAVTTLNPVVATTSVRYDQMSDNLRSDGLNVLSLTDEGLWLRQGGSEGQAVIHAVRTNADATVFYDVSILAYYKGGGPKSRIKAKSANLIEGAWELHSVKSWPLIQGINSEERSTEQDVMIFSSTLTPDRIRDRFGTPAAIPIWKLPKFIQDLKISGFSARRHMVWLNMEIAQPVFLVAMVLIASAFTMRHTRFGNTGVAVLSSILLGFALYFVRNFAQILGENGQIPVLLAAWAPPIASVMLALGFLLHMEDG
ncbi:LPS export ABC transporter permease LptG [Pseudopelagicola sp. nBUS_20]|uniref:LPS export ABC transporter permease LptG n=1 Tax=Pseudopelagicola sp. nBUS_20 TaxID=3395317 RepID=UPI003EBAAB35